MKFLGVLVLLILTGCVTNPLQAKRDKVIECIKDLKQNDSATLDAFEVCRQVYQLNKLPEPKGRDKMTLDEMKDTLINQWSESMDLDALVTYFEEQQREYLDGLTAKEIKELYKQNKGDE